MAGRIGYGATVRYSLDSGTTWNDVDQTTNIKAGGISTGKADITHNQSPDGFREFAIGLNEANQFTTTVISTASILSALHAVQYDRTSDIMWEILFADSTLVECSGFISDIGPDSPLDDKITFDFSVTVSGPVTVTVS